MQVRFFIFDGQNMPEIEANLNSWLIGQDHVQAVQFVEMVYPSAEDLVAGRSLGARFLITYAGI